MGIVAGGLAVSWMLALLTHDAGVGDNALWLPHDPLEALLLAVVLGPTVAGLALARARRSTRDDQVSS